METTEKLLERLNALERKLYAIRHLNSQVYLDSVTAAPSDTSEGRGIALEYLSGLEYEAFASEETGALLRELVSRKDELTEQQYRQAEFLLRSYEDTACIPADEYIAWAVLLNDSEAVWHKAKVENDFASFAPYLEKIVETSIAFTNYWDPKHEKDPYDVLLNRYEYGLTMEKLDAYFSALKRSIVPLLSDIVRNGKQPANDFLFKEYPLEAQRVFTDFLMESECIDRAHCNVGETEHPFTLEFNKNDVRITTHYHLNDVMSSAFSVLHEGGHALYELHTGDALKYTSLAAGASMGLHESQSRFFENMIGRSEGFTAFILKKMKTLFPEQLENVSERAFYCAVNRAEPSLIRTEADELTYCLHVMIRYEIEKMLIHREITVSELPAVWNAKYQEYLGVKVPDDTHGVLQDSHWSGGSIGYFPTYALGNAYAAQICEVMKQDVDLESCERDGNLAPAVDWLSEHLYQYGCLYDPEPMLRKICGAEFTPQPYIDYLERKFRDIYGL